MSAEGLMTLSKGGGLFTLTLSLKEDEGSLGTLALLDICGMG